MTRGRVVLLAGAATLVYALATPFVLRPWFLASGLLPHVPGPIGAMEDADLFLNIWILAWTAHAVLSGSASLFDGNIFHPAPNTIAGSENMLAHLPVTAASLALSGDALVMFKAFVLESFALSGLAMFLYVWHHTRSAPAALVAGAAFTFTPFRVHTLGQPQYLGFQYFPLALLAVDLWLERRRFGWLVGIAAAVALQALACVYLGFFTIVLAPVYAAVRALQHAPPRARAFAWALLAMVAGASVLAPLAIPYLEARAQGMIPAWNVAWIRHFSWPPDQYLTAAFVTRAGLVTVAVVVFDLLARRVWRRSQAQAGEARVPSPAWALWAVFAASVILSAGPVLTLPGGAEIPLPYRVLHALVPGFSSVRAPLRFNLAAAAALAGLAGFAVARWITPWSRRARLAAAAVLVLGCVVSAAPRAAQTMPAQLGNDLPEAYRWLVAQGEPGPLLEIPAAAVDAGDVIGNERSGRYMLASTAHWLPLINGYTAYPPPAAGLLAAAIRDLPDPEALAALVDATHARWILVHRARLTGREAARWPEGELPGLREVARFGTDQVLEVTREPERPWREEIAVRSSAPAADTLGGLSRAPLPAECRTGRILAVDAPTRMFPIPLPLRVPVRFTNESSCAWPALGVRPEGLVGLTYRWTSPSGKQDRPGPFSQLLQDVAPGSTQDASMMITPPAGESGPWELEVQLRQHGEDTPLATTRTKIDLRPIASSTPEHAKP